jgi:hypothetical protein
LKKAGPRNKQEIEEERLTDFAIQVQRKMSVDINFTIILRAGQKASYFC